MHVGIDDMPAETEYEGDRGHAGVLGMSEEHRPVAREHISGLVMHARARGNRHRRSLPTLAASDTSSKEMHRYEHMRHVQPSRQEASLRRCWGAQANIPGTSAILLGLGSARSVTTMSFESLVSTASPLSHTRASTTCACFTS